MVTHLVGVLGCERAFSSSSSAPFCFLSFLTSESMAFSAHFSSSSPCFQPRSRLTAGDVNGIIAPDIILPLRSNGSKGDEKKSLSLCDKRSTSKTGQHRSKALRNSTVHSDPVTTSAVEVGHAPKLKTALASCGLDIIYGCGQDICS